MTQLVFPEVITLESCDRRLQVLALLMRRASKQEGTILVREELQDKIDYWLDQRFQLQSTKP